MTSLSDLRREHRELLAIAQGIAPDPAATPTATERMRQQLELLARRLGSHLTAETVEIDRICGPEAASPLRIAGDLRQREAAALGESMDSFGKRWGRPRAIEQDVRAFSSSWSILRAALERLIGREENDIYPASPAWSPKPLAAPAPTGIAEMDRDHERIFAVIGGMRAAIGGGRAVADANILAELVAYAENHFALEEDLMESRSYPGLEDHRREHHLARTILHGFRNDHLDGRAVESVAVLAFLENWLESHIAATDGAMARFLAGG